jgi:hypothetical protein
LTHDGYKLGKAMENLVRALMESPIYWLMPIRQRLDLIQRLNYQDSPCSQFRQRALLWVKTESWEEGDSKDPGKQPSPWPWV